MSSGEIAHTAVVEFVIEKHKPRHSNLREKKFVSDISASSLQVIINQSCSLIIFFIASTYFDKNAFGEINWCLAVLMLSFAILGCGIDQVAVQKIASGNNVAVLQKIYLFHVLITGILFLTLLLVAGLFTINISERFNLFLLLSIGQLFAFISSPFKQIANGKEKFSSLLIMSTCANVTKVLALLVMAMMNSVNIYGFAFIYIIAAIIEWLVCLHISKTISPFKAPIQFEKKEYITLITESLPQLGIVMLNSAIARFDWILLGVVSTSAILAEYSFAYKAFELSTFPLLIIAPVLLPKVSRWFSNTKNESTDQKLKTLFLLAKSEIMLACFLSLVLNMLWVPVIDMLTHSRYGKVNALTILTLSCSVPFLYVNNILWSVNFAQRKMKLILGVFIVTFFIACIGDAILIPFFKGEGAAIAYLAAIVYQTFHFTKRTAMYDNGKLWRCLLSCCGSALISGLFAKYFTNILWVQLVMASGLYVMMIVLLKQFKTHDLLLSKNIFSK
jgi:O-antigen/teichoic acid export membrane protein